MEVELHRSAIGQRDVQRDIVDKLIIQEGNVDRVHNKSSVIGFACTSVIDQLGYIQTNQSQSINVCGFFSPGEQRLGSKFRESLQILTFVPHTVISYYLYTKINLELGCVTLFKGK